MSRIKTKLRQIPLAVALIAATLPPVAFAQESVSAQVVVINIPAQPAGSALKAFVEQTKFQLIYAPELVNDVTTNAVSGSFTPREALAKLLDGTGITIVSTGGNAATLQKKSSAVTSLDAVVVTARKKEERMIDVPIAMSAMSGEDLKRRGASSIADVLQDAPSVSAYDMGNGASKISVRGVSTGLGGNDTGYYLNETPFTGVTVPIAPDVRAWDIDHVEILRGPQGTLFGEGSMGGTIRILTNRPRLGEFSFAGELSGSSTAGGGGNSGEKLMLNVPLGEMLAVRVAATHEEFDGWINDASTGVTKVNGTRIDTGRVAVVFEPTDRLRIDGSLWKYNGHTDKGNGATDDNQLAPTAIDTGLQSLLRGLSANYDFDQFSLFYGYSSGSYTIPWRGTVYGGPFSVDIGIDVQTHELRLGSTGKGPLKWTVGYYHRAAQRSDHYVINAFSIDTANNTDMAGSSVFGEVSYTLPQLPIELTAGLRHFVDHVSNQDFTNGTPATPEDAHFKTNNPRFSVAWHVDPLWQIYASAAKGFRSGQTQPSVAVALAPTLGLTLPSALPPDSIWSYELGTKASLLDHRLIVESAVYHSDWKDFAVSLPLGTTGSAGLTTAPGVKIDGIEGSLRFEVTRNFSAALNASYTRSRYSSAVAGTSIQKGTTLDSTSPFVFGASADYSFPAYGDWTGRLHAGFQHSSPRSGLPLPGYSPGDSINNLNARLGFDKGNWTVSLFGENLTNDSGAASFRTSQAVSATETVTYSNRIRPRTIGLELRYWMGR